MIQQDFLVGIKKFGCQTKICLMYTIVGYFILVPTIVTYINIKLYNTTKIKQHYGHFDKKLGLPIDSIALGTKQG